MQVWFQQAMKVDDYVAHLGIIYRLLRLSPPCVFRAGIIGKYSNKINLCQIDKFKRSGIAYAAAHYEV